MGIFSGIFGDSEKESKSEINVVNVYEDKNNPQGRKFLQMHQKGCRLILNLLKNRLRHL